MNSLGKGIATVAIWLAVGWVLSQQGRMDELIMVAGVATFFIWLLGD